MFKLEIELGNAAMQTPYDVARALEALATKLYECGDPTGGIIRDENGNTVGRYEGEGYSEGGDE